MPGCKTDAMKMKKVLEECKFSVSMYNDLGLEQMIESLDTFLTLLKNNDEVVFYFSGHGMEYHGRQLFVPCKMIDPSEESGIESTAFKVGVAIQKLCQKVNMGIKIIISDACRAEYTHVLKKIISRTGVYYDGLNISFDPNNQQCENPKKGGVTKKQRNVVRMFAVSQGQQADADIKNGLSVYTKSLTKHLNPDQSLRKLSTMIDEDLKWEKTNSEILFSACGPICDDFRF